MEIECSTSDNNDTVPGKAQIRSMILLPVDDAMQVFEMIEVEGVEMMLRIVDCMLGTYSDG